MIENANVSKRIRTSRAHDERAHVCMYIYMHVCVCVCVLQVTIGGIQSNHARATAVASRFCGLDSHLVLRTSKLVVDEDPGLVGNLLVERMVGASVHLCTKEEYGKVGSEKLGEMVSASLTEQGKKPYVIPVGGSNALGSWGYMEMIDELKEQLEAAADAEADADASTSNTSAAAIPSSFDNLVVACGSGGTVAGIGLALDSAGLGAKLTAYGVCDSPEYFYNFVDMLLAGMRTEKTTNKGARELVTVLNAKGRGYAISTEEELAFVHAVALRTGIILDPVYSGKALYNFVEDVKKNPDEWKDKKVLFVHTGGLLGMYEKAEQLQPLIGARNDVFRMKVQ